MAAATAAAGCGGRGGGGGGGGGRRGGLLLPPVSLSSPLGFGGRIYLVRGGIVERLTLCKDQHAEHH